MTPGRTRHGAPGGLPMQRTFLRGGIYAHISGFVSTLNFASVLRLNISISINGRLHLINGRRHTCTRSPRARRCPPSHSQAPSLAPLEAPPRPPSHEPVRVAAPPSATSAVGGGTRLRFLLLEEIEGGGVLSVGGSKAIHHSILLLRQIPLLKMTKTQKQKGYTLAGGRVSSKRASVHSMARGPQE